MLAAVDGDPSGVRAKFGRSPGLGRAYYCYVRGTGVVVSVDRDRVGLALDKDGNTDVVLLTGMLFGNAVRDATGLLNAGEFVNSQHFNEVSTALNRIVTAEVIEPLKREVGVGKVVHFVGCAEVRNEAQDLKPLRLVPVKASVE